MNGLFLCEEDWSFWDIASPEEAVIAITDMYGSAAALKAAECVVVAREDGRDDDCRFWIAVYARICAIDLRRSDAE